MTVPGRYASNAKRVPIPSDGSAWWRTLTALPEKAWWYEREVFFRESQTDLRLILGSELEYHLQRTAIMMIRPDGIAGRRVETIVRFIIENSFRIIHAEYVHYTPILVRELWRYQLNRATLDRIVLLDLIHRQSPGLILILQDDIGQQSVPAPVRLWSLKGSAVQEWRDGRTLRDICTVPNRALTLVHAADEPIDLIREMGVLLSTHRRLEWAKLFASVDHDRNAGVDKAISMAQRLYMSSTAADFNIEAALARMRATIAANSPGGVVTDAGETDPLKSTDPRARLLQELSLASTGGYFPLREWLTDAENVFESFDPWDVITAASFAIKHNVHGVASTIPGNAPERWYAGQGQLAQRP